MPAIATMQGASIVVITMSRASFVVAVPVRSRNPARVFLIPTTAALLPVPGDMTVAWPHSCPCSRVPDMARNGNRDVLDYGR